MVDAAAAKTAGWGHGSMHSLRYSTIVRYSISVQYGTALSRYAYSSMGQL